MYRYQRGETARVQDLSGYTGLALGQPIGGLASGDVKEAARRHRMRATSPALATDHWPDINDKNRRMRRKVSRVKEKNQLYGIWLDEDGRSTRGPPLT